MNFAVDYIYRLAPRGGAGLACDAAGVALGATDLARVHLEGARRRCEVRPPGEIGRVLKAAYGPQPDAVVQRLHRGLNRTAKWLEAGDLCHAGVEAVMLGFPDLTPTAMAKLAELADLEKRGAAWEDEPRVPAGQAGGGQWTTGGGGAAAASAKPVQTVTSLPTSKPMPGPAAHPDPGRARLWPPCRGLAPLEPPQPTASGHARRRGLALHRRPRAGRTAGDLGRRGLPPRLEPATPDPGLRAARIGVGSAKGGGGGCKGGGRSAGGKGGGSSRSRSRSGRGAGGGATTFVPVAGRGQNC